MQSTTMTENCPPDNNMGDEVISSQNPLRVDDARMANDAAMQHQPQLSEAVSINKPTIPALMQQIHDLKVQIGISEKARATAEANSWQHYCHGQYWQRQVNQNLTHEAPQLQLLQQQIEVLKTEVAESVEAKEKLEADNRHLQEQLQQMQDGNAQYSSNYSLNSRSSYHRRVSRSYHGGRRYHGGGQRGGQQNNQRGYRYNQRGEYRHLNRGGGGGGSGNFYFYTVKQ